MFKTLTLKILHLSLVSKDFLCLTSIATAVKHLSILIKLAVLATQIKHLFF